MSLYSQYGYLPSAFTSGASSNPLYGFTIGDTSQLYINSHFQLDNPSIPFCSLLYRVRRRRALIAICPKESHDDNLMSEAKSLRSFLLQSCIVTAKNNNYSSTIAIFESEGSLNSYITNHDYNQPGYQHGKIAFAIVFNSINSSALQWDYSFRVNYRYTHSH